MKKTLYFIVSVIVLSFALLQFSTAFAQPALSPAWRDDGTVVRLWTETDLVGIGTVNPQGKLQVVGGDAIFEGNVGIGTTNPGAKLTVNGPMIRQIARRQGYMEDGTDSGPVSNRTLNFTKTQNDTGIRVLWSDNFRVIGSYDVACQWEIKFNGNSCTNPGGLYVSKYQYLVGGGASIEYDPAAMAATCENLPAGTYTIQGYVSRYSGNSDCYTGWGSIFNMEAEEVY